MEEKDIFAINFYLLQKCCIVTSKLQRVPRHTIKIEAHPAAADHFSIRAESATVAGLSAVGSKHIAQFPITDGPYHISVDWGHDAMRSRSDT
jgi:hypothetical protein